MAKRMLIDALHPEETRIAIADDKQIYDFDFVSAAKKQLKGNIYLAKITRVEPSLQAAFVEYGGNKQGFLPFSEIHPDYYQIPVSDRKRLMDEAAAEPQTDDTTETQPRVEREESSSEQPSEPESAQPEEPFLPSAAPAPEHAETSDVTPPAYLTEGAIDTSVSSEEIPHPEPTEIATLPAEDLSAEALAKAETPGEAVETLSNEVEEAQTRRRKANYTKRYRIQEVIRRGQIVLVQVIKEERGNKGVSLTTYLSLAGRYCVLMPNSPKDGGISRKIMSQEDRKRLKVITNELRLANGMSVIIRTAGMDRTRAEIQRDYDYLVKVWNQIREDTLKATAPALIYEESDVIKRAIRDQYTSDIDEIWIEGEEGYTIARDFMKLLLPSHTPRIKQYNEPTPLFYAYNIEEQLLSMHDPVVKLRSGGYIVINPTEALISIDVNSGRSTGERNIEETATKTNLEAAAEVARQLRLRDLAGLIVIDFIDMLESRNRRSVEKALKDSLKLDRAKIQLGRISPFGLLEMSRQRLRPSISETNMVQCPHCVGRGYVRSNESMSIQLIRVLEKEASSGSWGGLRLVAPQEVALHLLNYKRDFLSGIETRHGITIQVIADNKMTASEFTLEKMRRGGSDTRRPQPRRQSLPDEPMPAVIEGTQETAAPTDNVESIHGENDNRRGGRRRGRRGGRSRFNNAPNENAPAAALTDEAAPAPQETADISEIAAPETGERPERTDGRPPRQRGGRGRRRWRDRDGAPRNDSQPRHEPMQQRVPDGPSLPAFATEKPIPVVKPRAPEPTATPVIESTPRDPNAPPKKGWWQKMIALEE